MIIGARPFWHPFPLLTNTAQCDPPAFVLFHFHRTKQIDYSLIFQVKFLKGFLVKYYPPMHTNLMQLLCGDDVDRAASKIASILSIEFDVALFVVSQV